MAMHDVVAVILGGGQGSRLYPLTRQRAKPAVPIGGKYRLIDIPISNCLNSQVMCIYVLTQFLSVSLHRHIYHTYKLDVFSGGFVDILAAQKTADSSTDWYQGTADAVRKQLRRFLDTDAEDFLILSGDHLYRMDYRDFVRRHRERRADFTIGVYPVAADAASRFGILQMDADGRVTAYREKPKAAELSGLESVPHSDQPFLASMGIYVVRRAVLQQVLEATKGEDFGREIIPAGIGRLRTFGFRFDGYWADIGTIGAFYEANLMLTRPDPPFRFYEPGRPIFTRPRFLPASRLESCRMDSAVVAEGCELRGSIIRDSVIGLRSMVREDVELTRSITMGADFYETEKQRAENRRLGRPHVGIGRGCRIEGAIIDKNARIGEGVVIRPPQERDGDEPPPETAYSVVRDGVVVIPRNATVPSGTVI